LLEVLEPVGRQLGVTNRVLDVAMAQVGLQGPRIVTLVGQGEKSQGIVPFMPFFFAT
jgi:hypothetical protein